MPLFSLRSESDGGIGDFEDLDPILIDWAARFGQSVVARASARRVRAGRGESLQRALVLRARSDLPPTRRAIEEIYGIGAIPHRTRRGRRARARAGLEEAALQEAFRRFLALAAASSAARAVRAVPRRRARRWLSDYAILSRAARGSRAGARGRNGRSRFAIGSRLRSQGARRGSPSGSRSSSSCSSLPRRRGARAPGRRERGVAALMGDLPFAPSKNSADVWANPETLRLLALVGAPPDAFSDTGQRWGLPMYRWQANACERMALDSRPRAAHGGAL